MDRYPIFDSHAHYDDESFNEDREEVIEKLKTNNIIGILNCGASLEGSIKSVELSEKYPFIFAAVGIHPEFADMFDGEVKNKIMQLSESSKVKAIGEIGLDYHYEENPTRELQLNAFRAQMEIAGRVNLPVVIHDREAHEDTLKVIKEFPDVIGVVHCFSGSSDFALECIKAGYYIGFTGVITFKNAKKIIEVAKKVPLNRMLVETDCPYMTPVPYRGTRNNSQYIEYIIKAIASIKGITEEEISRITIKNTEELLKVKI